MRQKSIMSFPRAACRAAIAALLVAITPAAPALAFDAVALDGRTFVNKGLVAVGRIPAHLRDKLGETFGSGSGLAIDPQAWMRKRTVIAASSICCPTGVTTSPARPTIAPA